jgi:predicted  nucleic acid-binding Zn-ribbon protein
MDHCCSYCKTPFVSVVVGIPKTTEKICKGCLIKMIEKINNTITKKD